ncbi:YtxH domain-containing protein [Candidatus Curtissbacteria bacterium]|nr:YtxH domain-containing protein [Candidatus Curtissbacteria bacterium]
MNDNQNTNLSALLAGLVIGAAAVYLLNTENGKKLKDQLLEDGQKWLEKIAQDIDGAQNKIEDKKEIVEEKIAEASEKIEEAAENYVETLTSVPEHIAAVQKKGRKFFFRRGAHAHHHVAES